VVHRVAATFPSFPVCIYTPRALFDPIPRVFPVVYIQDCKSLRTSEFLVLSDASIITYPTQYENSRVYASGKLRRSGRPLLRGPLYMHPYTCPRPSPLVETNVYMHFIRRVPVRLAPIAVRGFWSLVPVPERSLVSRSYSVR
jgi:hypothetical protein